MVRSGTALRGFLGDEIERYMVVQKTEHGFDMLDNRAKKYLRSNGVTPDTWILPEGTATFLQTVRPENRDYYLAGPAGPEGYRTALNNAPATAVKQIAANSCSVYESKSFEMPGAPTAVDPLVRQVSVGEYVTMTDTVSDQIAPTDYKSAMRDIYVYDEQRDDFSRITLRNALKACCRFDSHGNLWFPQSFAYNRQDDQDTFMMRGGRVCVTFGDMDMNYLADETVQQMAETVVNRFLAEENGRNPQDAEPVDTWAGDYPLGVGAAGAAGTSKFKRFFDCVRKIMPGSRVFESDYRPAWYPAGTPIDDEMGFWINTLSQVPLEGRGDASNRFVLRSGDPNYPTLANAMRNYPGAFDLTTNIVDWDVVRGAYAAVLSGLATSTPSEEALTSSALGRFIDRLQRTGRGGGMAPPTRDEGEVFMLLAGLLTKLTQFRGRALQGNWLKHYQYVAHKGLIAVAKTPAQFPGNRNAPIEPLEETVSIFMRAIDLPANDAAFVGTTADVDTALGLPDWIAAGAAAPAPPAAAPPPQLPAYKRPGAMIGAFDVPAMNAAFGALDGTADPPPKRARFGAVLAHGAEQYERGPGGAGFDAPDDSLPDPKLFETKVTGYTEDFVERYDNVKAFGGYGTLVKSVMLTFLHTPITEGVLLGLIDNNIPFPFDFIGFRPRITHSMATGILLKAGADTAETLVGHADFQLSDDVVRKMHYGHFTLYSKTIVWKSDNIYLAENIVSTGYVRGNDVSTNTLPALMAGRSDASMYIALIPATGVRGPGGVTNADRSGQSFFNPMDITGRFSTNVPHLANLDAEVGNKGALHYPGADFYANVWMMNNQQQQSITSFTPMVVSSHNTLCFQGHQMNYNVADRQYNLTTLNTGHFGDRVYPGCGKVRRMASSKYLLPVTYTNAFGATQHTNSLMV
jgi:hypothetical protein